MSTLTKILIVLLTISAIFLCGIVVTYVANADNYREKYSNLRADRDSLSKKAGNLTKQLNEKIARSKRTEDRLNAKIASLGTKMGKVQAMLDEVEREKSLLLQKVNSWTAIVKDFRETNDDQGQLLKRTLDELDKVQAQQVKQQRELKETTAALVEKMAIVEMLQAKTKRLFEEKSELQSRLDQLLRPIGKKVVASVPITPEKAIAWPAAIAVAGNIDLKGFVNKVDLKNFMAGISIGSADGVREGMKFYAIRGDEFVCEILIIDVDTEEAVGVLERVQYQPKVGDSVSTNL